MAVTAFNGRFSFKQDSLARLGDRALNNKPMSEQQRESFNSSPFMQGVRKTEELCWEFTCDRDQKRAKLDPSFRPQDSDFDAPKAYQYDKTVNYYKVLGIDEYASLEEVKKAYKKLSLIYHPDKSAGMPQAQKDEYAGIFIELKSAYQTLGDNPTRRQFDRERDRDKANLELHGYKRKEKPGSFNAMEVLNKLMETQKPAGQVINVPCAVKLEKFFYGGHKAVTRRRKVQEKFDGWSTQDTTYRIDVPRGAEQPHECLFRQRGDHHEGTRPDSLNFQVTAKPHERVVRKGNNLELKQKLPLGHKLRGEPYITAQATSVNGRHVHLWGRNPFYGCPGRGHAQLDVKVRGEGFTVDSYLNFTCVGGASSQSASSSSTAAPQGRRASLSGPSAENGHRQTRGGAQNSGTGLKSFLKRHGLGPPEGFRHPGSDSEEEELNRKISEPTLSTSSKPSSHGQGGSCNARNMKRRINRQAEQALVCELELLPIGDAITLFTKPSCTITFYSNAKQSTYVPPGRLRPQPMFAFVLYSPLCAKKKAHREWSLLKENLLPVLQATAFHRLQAARRILPRLLADHAAYKPDDYEAVTRQCISSESPPLPCKRLATEAFKRGDYYCAMSLYSRCVEEAESKASSGDTDLLDDEVATALSNRSACLAKVGQFEESLTDARKALERKPKWGRAWGRAGLAASRMGKPFEKEAMDCYMRAVEFDPIAGNVEALYSMVQQVMTPSADAAHPEKEKGSQALRNNEVGLAVACYTMAIALLPKQELAPGVDGAIEGKPDEHALFRSVLHANRCGAFCRLKSWSLALCDGRKAVAAKEDYVQARNKLGVALLGAGLTEQAYSEFARGLSLEGTNRTALAGRQACLRTLPLWKSVAARKRHHSRFAVDLTRPKGSTKVYAISDVFFDHKYNEDWAHNIHDLKFSEDVLIISGNMCDSRNALARALITFKAKFRRVFYVPGNHEMWLSGEQAKYPDTMAKLLSIFDLCDELEVDIFPAAVCEGVFIVPLLSWYNAEFDEKDPHAEFTDQTDQHCRWPIDKDMQVWKYMSKLNAPHLRHLYHGTVITFSHFLPRRSLIPAGYRSGKALKTMGCEMIDEQARAVGSKLHIFGHTRRHVWTKEDNVLYANFYHGLEDEHSALSPILCVWDGQGIVKKEVDIK